MRIAMTAPVTQEVAGSQQVATTAPVVQQAADQRGSYLVRFVMPAAPTAPAGPIRYAHFDPPWTPLFLRRNEVVLTVEG
jgi:hypothetical protein